MINDPDTGFIILAAFRYAVGRRSAAPSIITRWLQKNWKDIPPEEQRRIVMELGEEIDRDNQLRGSHAICPLGDSCDRETWVQFYNWAISPERHP